MILKLYQILHIFSDIYLTTIQEFGKSLSSASNLRVYSNLLWDILAEVWRHRVIFSNLLKGVSIITF